MPAQREIPRHCGLLQGTEKTVRIHFRPCARAPTGTALANQYKQPDAHRGSQSRSTSIPLVWNTALRLVDPLKQTGYPLRCVTIAKEAGLTERWVTPAHCCDDLLTIRSD